MTDGQTEASSAANELPGPGIYRGVPFEVYRSWPYVNNSSLTPAMRSMAHYKAALEEPEKPPSDAMLLGTLVHCGGLEPLELAKRYVILPAFEHDLRRPGGEPYAKPRATNAYKDAVKEFKRQNPGKTVVSEDTYHQMMQMVTAIYDHPGARVMLDGDREVSIVWDDADSGIRCKGRIDVLRRRDRVIIDVKSCQDASDHAFRKWLLDFRVYRQAAMYLDGMETLTGDRYRVDILAVENAAPWGLRYAPMGPGSIEKGQREYQALLLSIAKARHTNQWPGYSNPDTWEVPEWALPPVELVSGGTALPV